MNKKLWIKILIAIAVVVICGITLVVLVWNGVILLNNPSRNKYPVRGVDVSHYQGEIDWPVLASEGIDFAFIKATEGSSHVDECFEYNYEEARKTKLYVGAYHFFSFDSKGETQAENFIKAVEGYDSMLPPVVDVEYYNSKNPATRESIAAELKPMLKILEEHYGKKPVIYTTEDFYEKFFSKDYEDFDIWIRDVVSKPKLSDGKEWTFWQYTNRETLSGYDGEEKYIDVNVFNGSKADFVKFAAGKVRHEIK